MSGYRSTLRSTDPPGTWKRTENTAMFTQKKTRRDAARRRGGREAWIPQGVKMQKWEEEEVTRPVVLLRSAFFCHTSPVPLARRKDGDGDVCDAELQRRVRRTSSEKKKKEKEASLSPV